MPSDVSQENYIKNMAGNQDFQDTPLAILAVAFQPTARGGPAHFPTGNIRIVSEARDLLHEEQQKAVKDSAWMVEHLAKKSRLDVEDDDWVAWLKGEIGLDVEDVEEELVVEEQLYYTCPNCNDELLV
jgi:hypothetical protein